MKKRIFIVDDHPLMRRGYAALIDIFADRTGGTTERSADVGDGAPERSRAGGLHAPGEREEQQRDCDSSDHQSKDSRDRSRLHR